MISAWVKQSLTIALTGGHKARRYARLGMRSRAILLLVAAMAAAVLVSGCGSPFTYFSNERLANPIAKPYKIVVNVNTDNLDDQLKEENEIRLIKRAIIEDIEQNIFMTPLDSQAYKIIVNVDVRELGYKDDLWGLLWAPFVYLGAPVTKRTGTAVVQVSIYYKDSETLKRYDSERQLAKWCSPFYYGRKYANFFRGNRLSLELSYSMEDYDVQ